jgi:hypothetical protein
MRFLNRYRGRPRAYKAKGATYFLIALIALVVMSSLFYKKEIQVPQLEAKAYDNMLSAQAIDKKEMWALKEENAALHEKLASTFEDRGRYVSAQAKQYLTNLVVKTFGGASDQALKIANCESGINNFNFSKKPNNDGSTDHGLFQVNQKWHAARFEKMFGVPFEIGVYIPELNVKYAKFLYDSSKGWGPWSCKKVLQAA